MKEHERQVAIRGCERWLDEDGLHVRLRVANEADRTLFVGRGVRRLELDAESGRLTVWLCDHGRDPDLQRGRCRAVMMPPTLALGAGEEAEISAVVPPVVYRLRAEGSDVVVEEHRITSFSRVTVNTAVAEAPFYYSPKGESAVRQLAAWGRRIGAEAELVSPPQAPTQAQAQPAEPDRDEP